MEIRNWKMNVNANRKLFWKSVSNAEGGKVESCSIVKDGNGEVGIERKG